MEAPDPDLPTDTYDRFFANLKGPLDYFLHTSKKLAVNLGKPFNHDSKPITIDDEELWKLKLKLEAIRIALKKADGLGLSDEFDRLWMRELRDIEYWSEDVLEMIQFVAFRSTRFEEFKQELMLAGAGKRKREAHHLFSSVPSGSQIGVKIKKITDRFREIAEHRKALQLGNEDGNKLVKSAPLNPTSSLPKCHLHGRADDMKKLIEWLKSDDVDNGAYSIKVIVGMAGVGKTTLVQHAYNDKIVQSTFDLKIWVHVSQQYDVVEVMRKILESIENTSPNLSELESLHRTVIGHLRGKRFLMVLDDMWDEDPRNWSSLQAPLTYGAKGSKVVVTTRSMKVSQIMCAKRYHLRCLTDDSSWLVCSKRACQGDQIKLDGNMIEIGKKIVSRCKGLPLAAEAVGVSLSFSHEEKHWNRVLENMLLTEDDQVSKILPALRVSYDFLPLHLKCCFAYCSLFPKGYFFEKNMLVHLWMAQGFIDSNGSSSLEEVGCKYFDDLLDRCFLQHSPSHCSTEAMYVMHDLYHELAEDVSGGEFTRSQECKVQTLDEKVRHSSMVPQELGLIEVKPGSFGGQGLRSFLLVGEKKPERDPICMKISRDLFVLDCLRALDLSNTDITILPSIIGNLIHLRYLSFQNSRIQCLPESISGLFNLQTLNLRECFCLKELPEGMKLLDNLRHLYLPLSDGKSISMPYGMGKMTNLQTLPLYVVGCEGEGCGIEELSSLINLRGEMLISGMNNIIDPQSAEKANMNNKGKVHKLTLEWFPAGSTSPLNMDVVSEVMERLQPHSNLEDLIIMGFYGTQFPSWLSDQYLHKLSTLDVKCCKNAKRLPSLGHLPSLKHLSIQFMDQLRRIDHEFCGLVGTSSSSGQSCRGFPKLETLVFKKMDAWEEWVGVENKDFPSLKYLTLNNCNVLRIRPQFPAKVNVKVKNCSLLNPKGSEPLHLTLRTAEMSRVYPLLILSECGSRFEETCIPDQEVPIFNWHGSSSSTSPCNFTGDSDIVMVESHAVNI